MTKSKHWLHSRTLWVNAGTVVAYVLTLILEAQGVLQLPSQTLAWVGIGLAGINAALRVFATSQPIEIGGRQPAKIIAKPDI